MGTPDLLQIRLFRLLNGSSNVKPVFLFTQVSFSQLLLSFRFFLSQVHVIGSHLSYLFTSARILSFQLTPVLFLFALFLQQFGSLKGFLEFFSKLNFCSFHFLLSHLLEIIVFCWNCFVDFLIHWTAHIPMESRRPRCGTFPLEDPLWNLMLWGVKEFEGLLITLKLLFSSKFAFKD